MTWWSLFIQTLYSCYTTSWDSTLKSMLDHHPDIEVVGVARDGIEAVSESERLQPDLILMDAQMPEMDGIQASREIKQRRPHIQILFMAVHPIHAQSALSAGVDSYIMKDCGSLELMKAIRSLVGFY